MICGVSNMWPLWNGCMNPQRMTHRLKTTETGGRYKHVGVCLSVWWWIDGSVSISLWCVSIVCVCLWYIRYLWKRGVCMCMGRTCQLVGSTVGRLYIFSFSNPVFVGRIGILQDGGSLAVSFCSWARVPSSGVPLPSVEFSISPYPRPHSPFSTMQEQYSYN